MAKKSYARINAVLKACEILGVLAETKELITGNEVALRVQMSKGTVMCHLATLEKRGYVKQLNGSWQLSIRPAMLWAKGALEKFNLVEGKTYRTIDSVDKSIDILEFLGRNGGSDIPDVASAVGISQSNAGSHLETLADKGYVMEIANHYKLGMRLSILWARVRANLETELKILTRELENLVNYKEA
jgi:DNA-binding IclR family transcriptional regulator